MKLAKTMNIFSLILMTALASCFRGKTEMNAEIQKNTMKKQHFSYLTMNGEFRIDPNDRLTANDKRNPSRILLSTSTQPGTLTKMTFFDHNDEKKLIAECGFQYIGSRPDPHFFPNTSKTSIWDIFEKVEDYVGSECLKFKYVISRSPHDSPIHMHLRYGDDVEKLLNMSKTPKNSWWAEYKGVHKN